MGEFDILLSEAFWMEQIIAACITAIVTLVVALVAVGPALKYTREDMKHRADNLARDHEGLKDGQQSVRHDIAQVANVASFLRDAQLKEDARREQLQGQQLDAQKMIDTLTVHLDYIKRLERENTELRDENAKLRDRLTPRSQSWTQGSEQSDEPEM